MHIPVHEMQKLQCSPWRNFQERPQLFLYTFNPMEKPEGEKTTPNVPRMLHASKQNFILFFSTRHVHFFFFGFPFPALFSLSSFPSSTYRHRVKITSPILSNIVAHFCSINTLKLECARQATGFKSSSFQTVSFARFSWRQNYLRTTCTANIRCRLKLESNANIQSLSFPRPTTLLFTSLSTFGTFSTKMR